VGGVEISLDITGYKHLEEALRESAQERRKSEAPAEVDDPSADSPG
jgi:hypothetical protein